MHRNKIAQSRAETILNSLNSLRENEEKHFNIIAESIIKVFF